MARYLIILDLDAKLLEQHYNSAHWHDGYGDIQRVFSQHGFNNIQGTVYLSGQDVRQAHGTLALQEVAIRYTWFEKVVSNVQFYNLANGLDAQFIIEAVGRARTAFERRLDGLRQQLLEAGLGSEKIEDILGKQLFTMDSLSDATIGI